MAKIEIDIKEYQGMRDKINELESALYSVSAEVAANKELVKELKTLVSDLENEGLLNRIFGWKNVVQPLKDIFL